MATLQPCEIFMHFGSCHKGDSCGFHHNTHDNQALMQLNVVQKEQQEALLAKQQHDRLLRMEIFFFFFCLVFVFCFFVFVRTFAFYCCCVKKSRLISKHRLRLMRCHPHLARRHPHPQLVRRQPLVKKTRKRQKQNRLKTKKKNHLAAFRNS